MAQQPAAAPAQGAAPGQGPGAAPNAGDAVDRLADILGRLVAAPRPAARREEYKTPQFSGEGDIEYFIQQFENVGQANQWDREATSFYFREALRDGARDCGQSFRTAGIYASLRARYGLFPREARSRLNNLRKDYRTPPPSTPLRWKGWYSRLIPTCQMAQKGKWHWSNSSAR